MPNWCNAWIEVKGKPKDIKNFCKLFLFQKDDDFGKGDVIGEKYFARSFTHQSWKDFEKEHLGKNEVGFLVDFAWSCWSCMFEGYPNKKECITLEWAMKKYNVEVEIETEEGGMSFEEKITTKNGKPIYKSFEMPVYKCLKCGNEQSILLNYNIEESECYECGEIGNFKKIEGVK